MSGQTRTRLAVGDHCIVRVDEVNHPTGWWWGVVDGIFWKDSQGEWGVVEAHITGAFAFKVGTFTTRGDPEYGSDFVKPSVNYEVYPADHGTIGLIRMLLDQSARDARTIRDLTLRLEELRSVVGSMGVKPEVIREAVAEGIRAAKA